MVGATLLLLSLAFGSILVAAGLRLGSTLLRGCSHIALGCGAVLFLLLLPLSCAGVGH